MTGSRPDGIRVGADALVRHARSIDDVGETVRLGADAARRIRLGPGAYGQLCQALPAMLEPLHELAEQVMAQACVALGESGRSLRSAAGNYTGTDSRAETRLVTTPRVELPL